MQQYLADLIKINGPISVSNFMNEVLFNPKHGYYTNQNPFGKKGDFITAPEISQVFGELIGVYLVNLWQNNYQEQEINLVEMGAGNGTLMKDLLRVTSKIPNFLNKVNLSIIEISPKLQKIQQEHLKDFKIKWYDNFADFEVANKNKPLFFLANELFDCFAINQYLKVSDSWVERLVGLDEKGNFQFTLAQKNQELDKVIKALTENQGKEADIFEHSPLAEEFMLTLSKAIKESSGIGLVIDYGYSLNEFKDTLQALKNHKYSNIFKDLGKSDITALVNFKRLAQIAKKEGLQSWIVTQKEFLESLGIEIRRQKLVVGKSKTEQELINSGVSCLIDKDQMGELFKVLIIG